MRCRACDTVWLVSGPSSAAPVTGGDSDLDNTAPRAAVQRRGAERERRDLFASRPVEDGGVRETMRPPPSTSFGGVAARNENSVLFKVTDIFGPGAAARVKTPEPSSALASFGPSSAGPVGAPGSMPPPRDGKEDSGIIDLKALSSAPPRANRAPAPMLFGASEPPPAFSRDVAASSSSYAAYAAHAQLGAPRRNDKVRTVGMIAAGFAVVALCGLGVALAFGGSDPPPKAAAAALPIEPPPAVTPAPAAADPAPATASTETAANDAPAASSKQPAKKSSGKKTRRGGKSSASSAVITSKTPPPRAPKVKAADPCGCHGNFNCILACTAGKK